MNRIAYVGVDENIFTINPDGSDSKRLTGAASARSVGGILAQPLGQTSVLHSWPTWSPDGSRIAVSRVSLEGAEPQVSLLVIDAETGALTRIYENEPGASPVIAESVPHYMYWSANGEKLAFIASTTMALSLFVNDGAENAVVSSQGPLYFKWAQDGNSMLIHSRDTLFRAVAPFNAPPARLAPMDPVFRAPDLSSDGRTAAFLSATEQGHALLAGNADGSEGFREILPVDPPSALLWSPAGDTIAVADDAGAGAPGYRRLRLVDPQTGVATTLLEEPMAAFYWSPDGQRIAYVAIDLDTRRLVWKVVSVSGGEPWQLVSFVPSQGMLTAISFFDQYAHSHSVWSPDSGSLTFAGQTGSGMEESNGATPNQSSIYIMNTEPGSLPRRIASGTLAFWSWN